MFDPELLIAFIVVTGASSLIPGASMLFVMSQAVWRGARSGVAALVGMQLGYIVWWLLAGLGLGAMASAFPLAFRLLAVAGALYLAWLGVKALRDSRHPEDDPARPARSPSHHAFRDGALVAIGNPKALIYVVAILPPFIDPSKSIPLQLVVLALIAMVLDLAAGALYIATGDRLAKAMTRPHNRRRLDLAVGFTFLAIAAAILVELLWSGA